MLFVLSVQHNLTFNTRPAGNSRQFYPRPRYSREHCTRSRDYRGFYILFNPVPAENPRVTAGWSPRPRPCKTLLVTESFHYTLHYTQSAYKYAFLLLKRYAQDMCHKQTMDS